MIESKGWNWKIVKNEKQDGTTESYHYHILIQK